MYSLIELFKASLMKSRSAGAGFATVGGSKMGAGGMVPLCPDPARTSCSSQNYAMHMGQAIWSATFGIPPPKPALCPLLENMDAAMFLG